MGGLKLKKKVHNLFFNLTIFSFVVLIILDYFPEIINLSSKIIIMIIILFGIIAALTEGKWKEKERSNRILVFGTSIMLLLIFLTLIGGKSQSGIGINNPIIWLLYFTLIIPILFKKKSHDTNNKL